MLVDWTAEKSATETLREGEALLTAIRERNANVPVILLADRLAASTLNVDIMTKADEYVFTLEDTVPFIAARVMAAIQRYTANLLPPFNKALLAYMDVAEYSWAAPGHQGGIAFTRSPAGRVFFDFFGENLFRTDSGVERGSLGSLLEHSGPIGESEVYAARVFGAHRSYSVLTGTSGSNRTIIGSIVGEGRFALCDRNCHKSIEQGLNLSGGIPLFFIPTRNRYGVIGPIPPEQFDPTAIRSRLQSHPLRERAKSLDPVYAVVTNCTYDGLCYDAVRVQDLLEKSVDVDSLRRGLVRLRQVQSALSRPARDARRPQGPPGRRSDGLCYPLHAQAARCALADLVDPRPRGPAAGRPPHLQRKLHGAAVDLAALRDDRLERDRCRHDGRSRRRGADRRRDRGRRFASVRRWPAAHREFAERGEWFFWPWNAPEVDDGKGGRVAFADADPERSRPIPALWTFRPGEAWHGFGDIPDGWCMLDPIKVGIVCPGMGDDGEMLEQGIPAAMLSSYLYRHGIIPSRTTDFMVLCLFSMGVTKGKWGTLIGTLLDFKKDYDANRALPECLPDLVATAPDKYGQDGSEGSLGSHVPAHAIVRARQVAGGGFRRRCRIRSCRRARRAGC